MNEVVFFINHKGGDFIAIIETTSFSFLEIYWGHYWLKRAILTKKSKKRGKIVDY